MVNDLLMISSRLDGRLSKDGSSNPSCDNWSGERE